MAFQTSQMRICVFCSTQHGNEASFNDAASRLAQLMHQHDIALVYGGGTTGLMGAIAKERVRLGGLDTVIGVTPFALLDTERESRVVGSSVKELGTSDSAMAKLKGLLGAIPSSNPTANSEPSKLVPGWSEVVELPTDATYGKVVGVPSLSRRKALMVDFVKKGGPGSGFIALPGGPGSLNEISEVWTLRQMGIHSSQLLICNTNGVWDGLKKWMEDASQHGFLGDESKSFVQFVDTPEAAIDILVQRRSKATWRLPAPT